MPRAPLGIYHRETRLAHHGCFAQSAPPQAVVVRWYTVADTPHMDEYNQPNNQALANSKPARPGGVGSIIGAIIIIILLAFGAFYFWGARLNQIDNNPPPLILGNETASVDAQAANAATP